MTMVMYPWQTSEDVEREQAEAEILADAEFAQWLDEVMVEPDPATMTELEFLAYAADQAQNAEKVLMFTEQTLSEMEDEPIGADFCRQPFLY